ncbi:SPOR domain-containing protein [Paracoccus alkanivorans]|uniref:SPOR domain-containing protein n=1 Tax=Paracoccus alkanivorans TaxID=2116655 RepID=A0A3M0M5K6_9RHOB|nr:SPOR domain-containing protein [Paracoccus alkanivorans]RMC32889.1 SPOR domain-containing protein [Paracoccus alkanivorans]
MAVMDFREGGYVFSRHKVRREFAYDQNSWDDEAADPDDVRFAADPDGTESLTTRLARLTHYLGALASVALMIGLMVWGWQLVSRDVSGVPVIHAVEGEARTTPEDPGGELSSYTGYAVNDVAEGAEPAPIDQVAIAPAVVGLTDEDVAMGEFGITAREPSHQSEVPLSFDGEPVQPLSDSEMRKRAEAEAAAAAVHAAAENAVASAEIVDAPASEGPVNEVVTDENGVPAQAAAITAALVEAQSTRDAGALASSVRPARRPSTASVATPAPAESEAPASEPATVTAAVEAPAARPAPSAAEASEPEPAPVQVASGGPVVQLGAFDSDAIAKSEWSRLSGKFGSLFSGKGQVIQQHESNGRTFWRLRVAGFDDKSDAQNFCAAMKAGGTDCIALATQ